MNLLRTAARAVGSPFSLVVVVISYASGVLFDFSETWWLWIDRAVYTLTILLAIIVQAAQNRDTEAIQKKLDELIRSSDANDEMQGIEK